MGNAHGIGVVALAALLAVTTVSSRERDDDWKGVPIRDVPAAVIRSLNTSYPKEVIDWVQEGPGLDGKRYRAAVNFGSGYRIEVELVPDGTIVGGRDLSADVPQNDLPRKVADALKERYSWARVVYAQKLGKDHRTTYEVALRRGMKRQAITFSPDGDVLRAETEVPAKELPDGVQRAVERKFSGGRVARAVKVEAGKATSYQAVVSLGPDRAVGWLHAKPDGQLLGASEMSPPGSGSGR
jgi:hypothetical protein